MAQIVAIDDDAQILSVIKRALEKDGHLVYTKENTKDMKPLLAHCDLLLLDIMMPDEDGLMFCKKIRNEVDCPIIFLTAKTLEADMCEGFLAGADDYIKKPFSIVELRTRVHAHLRREQRENHQFFAIGAIRFDLSAKMMYLDQKEIKLTKSEYEICEFLAKNKGQVFSLDQIMEQIFGYETLSDRSAIREHIKNIRAKLHQIDKDPIETVWGIGYKWKSE